MKLFHRVGVLSLLLTLVLAAPGYGASHERAQRDLHSLTLWLDWYPNSDHVGIYVAMARPRQLQGKTVGIAGLPSDYTNLAAVVRDDGGKPKLVKTVVVNYALLQALLTKRVDAVEGVYWTWEALQARQRGYQVAVMHLERYGVPVYDELVLATGTRNLQREA